MTISVRRGADEPPVALSVAGLDPSGGAGLIADAGTFVSSGVYPMCVVATVTCQNTVEMKGRFDVPPEVVWGQLETLFEDRKPDAMKTGALGSAKVVEEVARFLADHYAGPLVVDPVLASGTGSPLFDGAASGALRELLLPRATLVTPNVSEVSVLAGFEVFEVEDMKAAALRLKKMGAGAVLVTGGRLEAGDGARAADVYCDADGIEVLTAPWLECGDVHGTGCVLSAAVTAGLAAGRGLKESVAVGRRTVRASMERPVRPGGGSPCAGIGINP